MNSSYNSVLKKNKKWVEARGDQDGVHMLIHGWFMSVYGKNHYNTVK